MSTSQHRKPVTTTSQDDDQDVEIAKQLQLYSFPMGPRRAISSPQLTPRDEYFQQDSNPPFPSPRTKAHSHRRSTALSLDSINSIVPSLEFDTTSSTTSTAPTTLRSSSGGWSSHTAAVSSLNNNINNNNISHQFISVTSSPTKTIDLSEAEKPLTPKSDHSARSPQIPHFITQRSGSFTKMMDLTEEEDNHPVIGISHHKTPQSKQHELGEEVTDFFQFLQEPYDEKLVELVRLELLEQKKQRMKDNHDQLSFLKMNDVLQKNDKHTKKNTTDK